MSLLKWGLLMETKIRSIRMGYDKVREQSKNSHVSVLGGRPGANNRPFCARFLVEKCKHAIKYPSRNCRQILDCASNLQTFCLHFGCARIANKNKSLAKIENDTVYNYPIKSTGYIAIILNT